MVTVGWWASLNRPASSPPATSWHVYLSSAYVALLHPIVEISLRERVQVCPSVRSSHWGAGRTPVEWTYEREIKQTVRSPRVIVCLQVCFLYWWGVSCHILSDCVQEACVSCCFMADQFQDQRKTQALQMCSNIFSNWLYRSVSLEQLLVLLVEQLFLPFFLLLSFDSPKLKLPSLPTETLCYRHLQQTHRGTNGVTHGVSPILSSFLWTLWMKFASLWILWWPVYVKWLQLWFDHPLGGAVWIDALTTVLNPLGAFSQPISEAEVAKCVEEVQTFPSNAQSTVIHMK